MRIRTAFAWWLACIAAIAAALVLAVPGGAVTGGASVSPAPSWAAYVTSNEGVCSGALVSPSYVLTAAHCVTTQTSGPCEFVKFFPAKSFTIYLARTGNKGSAKGSSYGVDAVLTNNPTSIPADGQCVLQNDVALLHLKKPVKNAPLWIAPTAAAVPSNSEVVLYGYGLTNFNDANSVGTLNRTLIGDWTTDTDGTSCDLATLISATCLHGHGSSAGRGGDSGGPWTISVDGNPVEALVFTGYDISKEFGYGTGVTQASTGAWLHSTLGIPTIAPGNIVRDPDGHAFLIDQQGYRHSIPDGGTYLCFTGQGAQVFPESAATIQLMAARTSPATCATGNKNVLIAGSGDLGNSEPNNNLTQLLTTAGYNVTESASLPTDLSSFGQVWWVDTSAPTSSEQDQLVAFAKSGRGLYLTGERPCCEDVNTGDTAMVNQLVVSVGPITVGGQGDVCFCEDALPVNPGVVGNLAAEPFSITNWYPDAPGGMTNVPDPNVFAYYEPGDITTKQVVAAAWDRSSLVGNGRLAVFMDINWAEGYEAGTNWTDVAQNVAFFLSGLSSPPAAPVSAPAATTAALAPTTLTRPQSATASR